MSTMKKTLALVLALVLIVSCIPATALTVFAEGETETTVKQVQLWDAGTGTESFTSTYNTAKTDRNTSTMSRVSGAGVSGNSALAYIQSALVSNGVAMTNTVGFNSAAALSENGFNTTATVQADNDILWFWVDSDMTNDMRLQPAFNGVQIGGGSANADSDGDGVNDYCSDRYVYTIVANSTTSEPELAKVYRKGRSAKVTGLGLVDTADAMTGTYSQLKFEGGWSGWVGIPCNMFAEGGTIKAGATLTKLTLMMRMYATVDGTYASQVAGECMYFDEFWLTSDGTMPNLSKAALLYDGDAVVEEPEATEPEATEPEVIVPQQTLLHNFNNLTAGSTYGTQQTTHANIINTIQTIGIGRSNAISYEVAGNNNNQNKNIAFGGDFAAHKIQAATDILWFWVDSDLSAERMVHVQVNGVTQAIGPIFTIDNNDGKAEIRQIDYVADRKNVEGVAPVNSDLKLTGAYARNKVPAGWYGWIGIPVSAYGLSSGSITSVQLRIYGDYVEEPVAIGDVLALDEFWLTSAELMPNLTNDELFYNGDQDYLSLNSRYGSGMIFQQNKPFMIHGKAHNGAEVKVELLDSTNTAVQTKTVTVGEAEEWSVLFEGVAGSYNAYSVKVTAGNLNKTISNVVFGEVWVAGGQSNMDYTINQTAGNVSNDTYAAGIAQAFGSDVDVAELQTRLAAEGSNAEFIRIYLQDTVVADLNAEHTSAGGRWTNGSVWNDVKSSSAIAFYYAEMLQKQLNVPVGIIETPRGGTSMAVWVDKDVLTEAKYPEAYKVISGLGYFTDTNAATHVASYFNSRINPFQGYEVKGVLWYQGENDRFNPQVQQALPPVLLESWSKVFTTDPANVSDTALDFVVFQIAPFIGYASGGVYPDANLMTNTDLNAAMREGFAKVAKTGNVVIVPIYDLSAVVDNHHPLNKLEVAKRLMAALNETYYAATFHDTYTGPAVSAVTYGEGTVTITFDRAVRYIQLTETGNQRINPRGGYTLPAATELWGDKANGFSLYTGKEYVSVETVAIDGNKVTLTVPEGVTSIAGVAYAYGVEVLSANIYSSTGLPALPFYAENPDYVPEPEEPETHQTQLWTLDESNDAFTGTWVSTNSNRNSASVTRSSGTGIGGSNALAYTQTVINTSGSQKQMTWIANLTAANLSSAGFKTTVTTKAANDVLWFWVDSDSSQNMRIQPTIAGGTLKGGNIDATTGMNENLYIYTIDNVDGTPTLRKVYHTQYASEFTGVGYINVSTTNKNENGNHLKFMDGWCGWVGIPMNMLHNEPAAGTAITAMQFFMRMNDTVDGSVAGQQVGDAFYFDEFWLTSDGMMPNLTNEQLFYNGDPVTPEPEVYNVTFNGTNLTSNGAATVTEGETYTATLTAAEGYVLPESVTVTVGGAAAEHTYNATTGELTIANVTGDVVITAAGVEVIPEPTKKQISLQNAEALADDPGWGKTTSGSFNPITVTTNATAGLYGSRGVAFTVVSSTKAASNRGTFALTATEVAATDIFWFWVDSDAADARLLQPKLQGKMLAPNFIYTIVNDNGTAKLQKVTYDGVADLTATALSLVRPLATGAANQTYAQILVPADWYGWIGIPVANFNGGASAAGTAPTGTVNYTYMRVAGATGTLTNQVVYFDEFWLTEENTLPNLTNEQLFYNPDYVAPTVYNVTFNGTNVTSNGAATVTEGETYTATLTAAEGYVLPESVTVTVGGAAAEHTYNATTGELTIAGVTGDVVITAVGEEEPEPEPVQVPLWNVESLADGATTGTVTNNTDYQQMKATVMENAGVLGSKAWVYTIETAKTNNNSETVNIDLASVGFDTTAKITTDQILWFWVDSDAEGVRRMQFEINGIRLCVDHGTTGHKFYTIAADGNGKPQIVEFDYQYGQIPDTDGVDGLSVLHYTSNLNADGSNNTNKFARPSFTDGWSGWVGLPLSYYVDAGRNLRLNDGDTLTKLTIQLYRNGGFKNADGTLVEGDFVKGETLCLDEFWLTDVGLMPKLSDEALLYKGDVEPLAFSGASLILEEGISVNFKVDGDVIKQGYENPYAVLKIRDLEYTVEGVYNETKDEYVFKLYNIRPDWMGETITAEIYATMDGEQVAGEAITYSVAQYCYNILQKNYATATEADKLATLLVNILSYGAAAQTYAGETANGLVTDDLTETWAGWITTDYTAAAADTAVGNELAEPGVTFQSASLFLRESVRIRLKLAGTVTGPITVKVTDAAGNAITEASLGGCNGYVFLDGLNAQQMRTVLKITVYSGEEAVSNTLTYSIRSYADSFILADSTTALAKLMKAMMIYGDSAAAYIQ